MRQAFIKRTYFEDATIGTFFVEGVANPIWHTVEKPWRDNEVKVSCIPEGTYTVYPYSSEKYPDVWQVMGVEHRSYILIHAANYESQLEGCIAPGLSAGYMKDHKSAGEPLVKAVLNSRQAIRQMKEVLKYPESFLLTIKS